MAKDFEALKGKIKRVRRYADTINSIIEELEEMMFDIEEGKKDIKKVDEKAIDKFIEALDGLPMSKYRLFPS